MTLSNAMLTDVKMPDLSSGSLRLSPSAFRFKFMVNSPEGAVHASAAQFTPDKWSKDYSDKSVEDLKAGNKGQRFNRYVVVGNPIRGYVATGWRGKMVRFKSEDGPVITGLIMPRNWGPQNLTNDPRLDLVSGKAVAYFLRTHGQNGYRDYIPVEAKQVVRIIQSHGGARAYTISTPSAKRTGGDIYLDEGLLKITGDFTKTGNRMVAEVDERALPVVIDRIMQITQARFRPVGKTEELIPKVNESNRRGQAQGSLAVVEGSEPTVGRPPVTARSVTELRAALPNSGLTPEQQKLIGAFLDSPLGKQLDGLTFHIADTLQNGLQGSFFENVVEIARGADPLTGPEEMLHAIWDTLPDDARAEFERQRVETINELLKEPRNAAEIAALEDLRDNPIVGGDDFIGRGYPRGIWRAIYPYASGSEFFAQAGSKRFKARVGALGQGFWARVKQWITDFIVTVKRALRLKLNQQQVMDAVLTGTYTVTPRTAEKMAAPQAQLNPIEQESREKAIEELEEEGRIPTQMFGEEYYVLDRERITEASVAASSAVAKQMFDQAGIVVTEQSVPEPMTGKERRAWIMVPTTGEDMTAKGRILLARLRAEIASKEEAPKPADRLANILNSIVINMELGSASGFSQIEPGVRNELAAAAQSDRSARGAALGALAGYRHDMVFVGRNLDIELGRIWSDSMGGDALRRLMDDLVLTQNRGDDLEVALAKATKERLPPKMARDFRPGTKLGKKVIEMIRGGEGEPWDLLRSLAEKNGWKIPTDEDLTRMKAWAEQLAAMQQLTPAEAEMAGDKAAALRLKAKALEAREAQLRKKMETMWERLTRPWTLKTQTGRQNIVRATGDYISANLLLKVGFVVRQVIDIVTAGAIHTPTRAVANAIAIHQNEVEEGRRSRADMVALWRDVGDSLKQAYGQRTSALRAAFRAAAEVIAGTAQGRNVVRLMDRVNVFDRVMQKADELKAAGHTTQAALLRMFTFMRFGFTVAQALDNLQGLPAVYQEMRQQVLLALRKEGRTRAEAENEG